MNKLLALAAQEGIIVEEFSLVKPLLGIYMCRTETPPVIGLSKSIHTSRERRCIMAEELGHHFTTVERCIPKEFSCYSTRMNISRAEYRALRWAADFLIPENNLLDIISQGLYEPWELAEYYNVTEQFANFRLRLFGARFGA